MSGYRLSGEADRDIEDIVRFTVERWGWGQAESDVADLHAAFELLSVHPELGRRIDHVRAEYRRFEHGSRSVYDRADEDGPTIIRVPHRRMLPEGRV